MAWTDEDKARVDALADAAIEELKERISQVDSASFEQGVRETAEWFARNRGATYKRLVYRLFNEFGLS